LAVVDLWHCALWLAVWLAVVFATADLWRRALWLARWLIGWLLLIFGTERLADRWPATGAFVTLRARAGCLAVAELWRGAL
jgi:hypothetical protein